MSNQTKYFVALNQFHEKIGARRIKKLLKFFTSIKNVWEAPQNELLQAGLEEKIVDEFCLKRKNIDPDTEMEKLAKENISVLLLDDPAYPKLLKEIYSPPQLLYMRGSFVPDDEFALAIVGARKLSPYGKQVASQLSAELANAGLTIVSGLAIGIDTIAHYTSLQNKKRTIAVIGSGLDWQSIYPSSNRNLAKRISEYGAVVSEYPIGTSALPHHFHARNRIIAGLSLGTLVVEAKARSGALITAKHSLDQNREVFAVPGSIYSENSIGPNNLIKSGAKLVQNADDILDELNLSLVAEYKQTRKIVAETPEEEKIIEILSYEPTHIDKIVSVTKLDTATINSTLIIMELKGKVKNLGNMNYIIGR